MEANQSGGLLRRLQTQGPTATDLLSLLPESSKTERIQIARQLIALGDAAVPELIAVLGGDNPVVWQVASAVLVKIGEPAVKPLVQALQTPDEQTRLLAAAVLKKMNRLDEKKTGWLYMQHEYHKLLRLHQQANQG